MKLIQLDHLVGDGGGDSEVQRTMLELLNQLDGF
jgi:ATP-dependent 26S proteasome regulatory subunit